MVLFTGTLVLLLHSACLISIGVRKIYFITNIERRVTLRHSKGKRKGLCPHASSASMTLSLSFRILMVWYQINFDCFGNKFMQALR